MASTPRKPEIQSEVDEKLLELNSLLEDVGQEPIDLIAQGNSPDLVRQQVDTLTMPNHIESRADFLVAQILSILESGKDG